MNASRCQLSWVPLLLALVVIRCQPHSLDALREVMDEASEEGGTISSALAKAAVGKARKSASKEAADAIQKGAQNLIAGRPRQQFNPSSTRSSVFSEDSQKRARRQSRLVRLSAAILRIASQSGVKLRILISLFQVLLQWASNPTERPPCSSPLDWLSVPF